MKILLIFTLYLISVSGNVTGYSGGGVLIKCKYDREYTSNKKYFCKGSWSNCGDLIRTGDKNKWVDTGRFSLIDKPSSAEFWVMIRELTIEDSGLYQCAVDIDWGIDDRAKMELKIHEGDVLYKTITTYYILLILCLVLIGLGQKPGVSNRIHIRPVLLQVFILNKQQLNLILFYFTGHLQINLTCLKM
uniref:Immunoglobulin domain-containing protein n=1 Tax=Astyanax mexicanus TaxID=7994 RepID=A0A8B9GX60_ASTMX